MSTEPLGLLRIRAEERLKELSDVSGETMEDLWEFMTMASEEPAFLRVFGKTGTAFWDALQKLKKAEAEELNTALG